MYVCIHHRYVLYRCSQNATISRSPDNQRPLPPDDDVSASNDDGYSVPYDDDDEDDDDDDRPSPSCTVPRSRCPSSSHVQQSTLAADEQWTNLYLYILSVAGVEVDGR